MIQIEDIKKLAELSRIEVPEEELKELAGDIESILEYISQIQGVASAEIIPEAGEHRNIMREDGTPHESKKHTETLLKAAPKREEGYVKVKKIISQD
jgi:aspartyl-tRNA(Asn)/glutamyl-tRNA(Gln) amidotransferase subunit C